MQRLAIIKQILSQQEIEIDSAGVGVDYKDTNYILDCYEPFDETDGTYILFLEKIDNEWEQVDLNTEELNEILSVLQEAAEQEITARDQEEKEAIQYAKDMQDTYRMLEYNRYH